jgi:hypothetical protein
MESMDARFVELDLEAKEQLSAAAKAALKPHC